jgi:hypothetical protein
LVPLLAGHGLPAGGDRLARRRQLATFVAGFGVVTALAYLPIAAHTDPVAFLSRTLGYQAARNPADSLWAALGEGFFGRGAVIHDGAAVLHALLVGAVVVWALALFRVPRSHDTVGVAAVSAAVMIAVEVCQGFYSLDYTLWFIPLVIAAVLLDGRPTIRPGAADRTGSDAAHPSTVPAWATDPVVAGRSALTESH